jgi:hypothetical protein
MNDLFLAHSDKRMASLYVDNFAPRAVPPRNRANAASSIRLVPHEV